MKPMFNRSELVSFLVFMTFVFIVLAFVTALLNPTSLRVVVPSVLAVFSLIAAAVVDAGGRSKP